MAQWLDKSTVSVSEPIWNGASFNDRDAQQFWSILPAPLQAIAIAEMNYGNKPESILRNTERQIVLLAFHSKPQTAEPADPSIRIHREHQYGNYCYDGTLCTYEHIASGCLLAFADPNYREDH